MKSSITHLCYKISPLPRWVNPLFLASSIQYHLSLQQHHHHHLSQHHHRHHKWPLFASNYIPSPPSSIAFNNIRRHPLPSILYVDIHNDPLPSIIFIDITQCVNKPILTFFIASNQYLHHPLPLSLIASQKCSPSSISLNKHFLYQSKWHYSLI